MSYIRRERRLILYAYQVQVGPDLDPESIGTLDLVVSLPPKVQNRRATLTGAGQ